LILLIGSTSRAKTDGVRDAVDAIAALDPRFAGARLHPVPVGATGPPDPLSLEETIDGARARALSALDRETPGDAPRLAIGIEAGLATIRAGGASLRALVTWAAATDGSVWGYGAGGAIALPDAVRVAVERGEALGDAIDRLAGASIRSTRGAWGLLTRDLEDRRSISRTAALAALAPFYNPPLFRS